MQKLRSFLLLLVAPLALAGCHHSRPQNSYAAMAKANKLPPAIVDLASHSAKVPNLYYTERNPKSIEQTLDLYIPLEKSAKPPFPVIIWIHGGAWYGGDKNFDCPPCQRFTDKYAVASLNYRLTNEAAFPAQIHDVKAAVRFLRANAKKWRLDPNRIGVWGDSAGAYLAALLGTSGGVKALEGSAGHKNQSSRVQCVVDWCGPTDLNTIQSQSGPNIKMNWEKPGTAVYNLMGARMDNKSRATASPVTYASKDDPPFLIMHGDEDDAIPPAQSQELYDALKSKGVDASYHLLKGYGHSFAAPEHFKLVEEFFERTLQNPKSRQ